MPSHSALSTRRAPCRSVEWQEPRDLGGHPGPVGVELVGAEQGAFFAFAARVADHARAPADQGDGAVTGLLKPAQQAELLEVADVQAVGGRVETDVEHHSRASRCGRAASPGRSTGEPDPASSGLRTGMAPAPACHARPERRP